MVDQAIKVILASAVYLGIKVYALNRPVKIYVGRLELLSPSLSTNLHMKEHGIHPVIRIESPYEQAEDKMLAPDEIRQLRRQIVWNNLTPTFFFFDSLTIQDSNHVIVRRMRHFSEYQLARSGSKWFVTQMEQNPVQPHP